MSDRRPVILDVDTGIDDSLAILLACASPEIELVGLTCIGGNVPVDQVGRNTLAVLELAGRPDVPVVRGAAAPLRKPLVTAEDTHGPRGIGAAHLPDPVRALEPIDAASWLVEAARARPGAIELVTLGPLTNLALALELEPGLPRLLAGWSLMAGAYGVSGNTTPTSEWNVFVDPDAARSCLARWRGTEPSSAASGQPSLPFAMGLDVTEAIRLRPDDVIRLAEVAGAEPADAALLADAARPMLASGTIGANPILRFVVDALRFYFEFHARSDGFYGAFVHDPYALAATIDRALVRTRARFVDVETGPGPAHAMTVADWRSLLDRPPNLEIATDGDGVAFVERFVERVGGLAARLANGT